MRQVIGGELSPPESCRSGSGGNAASHPTAVACFTLAGSLDTANGTGYNMGIGNKPNARGVEPSVDRLPGQAMEGSLSVRRVERALIVARSRWKVKWRDSCNSSHHIVLINGSTCRDMALSHVWLLSP